MDPIPIQANYSVAAVPSSGLGHVSLFGWYMFVWRGYFFMLGSYNIVFFLKMLASILLV